MFLAHFSPIKLCFLGLLLASELFVLPCRTGTRRRRLINQHVPYSLLSHSILFRLYPCSPQFLLEHMRYFLAMSSSPSLSTSHFDAVLSRNAGQQASQCRPFRCWRSRICRRRRGRRHVKVGARCAKWQVCRRKRAFQESC
jgi:hypothetical protein